MSAVLSRESIKLMMQSQRIIKKEFGVRIDLDDDQAIAKFLAYANQSSSQQLIDCTGKLMNLLIPGGDADINKPLHSDKQNLRYYRGQEVTEPVSSQVSSIANETKPSKQITYRGQKVYIDG